MWNIIRDMEAVLEGLYKELAQVVSKPEEVLVEMYFYSPAGEEIYHFSYPS